MECLNNTLKVITRWLLFVVLMVCSSCSNDNRTTYISSEKLTVAHIDSSNDCGLSSYAHFLIAPGIETDSAFIEVAKQYLDTLTQRKPVSLIYFMQPDVNFDPDPCDQDWGEIREKTIVALIYEYSSMKELVKVPKQISHWKSGKIID